MKPYIHRYRELAEDLIVLPAHFMILDELNEDGTVAKRLGDLFKENHGLNIEDEDEFRHIVTDQFTTTTKRIPTNSSSKYGEAYS